MNTPPIQKSPPALLLILHGSPLEESANPVRKLAQQIQGQGQFQQVLVAFMECNHPSIEEGAQQLIASGASTIIVVPYLLHPGRHLVLDVPAQLRRVREQHPGVTLLMSDCIGEFEATTAALLNQIDNLL